MLEHDFSPASQLLTDVIVFCITSANAMGCCFFLLADIKGYTFGLPEDLAGAGSVSADKCLTDATLFGNCTWFIYDRSQFDIQARYIRSMHWSIVLLSTVGYGDILSFSDSECFIGFWWIFLGALICYFTACAVSSVVSQVSVLGVIQASRAEEVNRAMVRAGVSDLIRSIIRRYFDTNWSLNPFFKNQSFSSIFHDLNATS
uniref:Potassium channel domain-containing protein n=1 Tax=Globisporangium ultimum (strain ATCC 200006 / CBS 805.95 / DAOM BR144) TaxID=431595 RepID=K3WDY9_GLOUD